MSSRPVVIKTFISIANVRYAGRWKSFNRSVLRLLKNRPFDVKLEKRYRHFSTSASLATSVRPLPRIIESPDRGSITVHWCENGTEPSEYANIFLRDHCRCPLCYDSNSNSRLLEPYTLALDVSPKEITVDQSSVKITWSDKHNSVYSFNELKSLQSNLDDDVRYMDPILWKSEFFRRNGFPTYSMSDVIEDERIMLDWFTDLKRVGVTVLKGAGEGVGALQIIKDKLFGGYFKSTHYGTTFEVVSKKSFNNIAYTSNELWPHVDLPHFHHMPGIQVLHCIVQTKKPGGGASTLVDGFQAAQQLKELHPDSFDFLTKYKVRYRDIGSDCFGQFETFCERPIIDISDERYQGIYHINFQRDYANRGSVEEIQMFYKSLQLFTGLLIHHDNQFRFKLRPGEILIFNNQRVLHGRTGFEDDHPVNHVDQSDESDHELNQSNDDASLAVDRYLQGCYFDWDQIFWKIRPIKRRVENQK